MKASELFNAIKELEISACGNQADFEVHAIQCDSKLVEAKDVFVAVKGTLFDGHHFVKEAFGKGAKAAVIQDKQILRHFANGRAAIRLVRDSRLALSHLAKKFYADPASSMYVTGITGTNGKTTISYLAESIAKKAGFTPAVIGTINCRCKDSTLRSKNTTPGPLELYSFLSTAKKHHANLAIMEISSHALDQARAETVRFDCAIFTNLSAEHLDYHRNLENYFQAKARLFKALAKDACAVINSDDMYARRLTDMTEARVFSYGIDNPSDFCARDIKISAAKTEFTIVTPTCALPVSTRLLGTHNIYNILAAACWAHCAGIALAEVGSALEEFSGVKGRLEAVRCGQDFSVFVDYAHTDDALKNVLRCLRTISEGKIFVVFGCGGGRDKTKRPKMGRIATQLCDYAIITTDNPRLEDPEDIARDIVEGITTDNYCVILDRQEAIQKALGMAKKGDVVLIAGKGHENYQIIKDRTLDFDDCETARQCLAFKS